MDEHVENKLLSHFPLMRFICYISKEKQGTVLPSGVHEHRRSDTFARHNAQGRMANGAAALLVLEWRLGKRGQTRLSFT